MGKVKSGGQSDFSGDFCSKIGKFDTSTEIKTCFVNFYEKNTSTIKKKLVRLKFFENTFRNYLTTLQWTPTLRDRPKITSLKGGGGSNFF